MGNLRAFVRTVESGSFSAAADQMRIAKSALSRRVRELERHLGVDLLLRSTRRIQMTDAGERFYDSALRILADVAEAEAVARDERGNLAGLIRLAAPLSFGTRHLTSALADFTELYPAIRFEVELSDSLVDLVAVNADLGLRIGFLKDSDLIARRLASTSLILAAAPGFWDKHGRPERPEDLSDYDGLFYKFGEVRDSWPFTRPDGTSGRVAPRPNLRANNGEVLMQMAERGIGVVIEPSFIIHKALQNGTLEAALIEYKWPRLSLHAIYAPTRHLSPRVRAFIDFLADRYSGVPPWEADLPFKLSADA